MCLWDVWGWGERGDSIYFFSQEYQEIIKHLMNISYWIYSVSIITNKDLLSYTMKPDIIFFINGDIADGGKWIEEGINNGVFRDIPINQVPDSNRLKRSCSTAGFYLTTVIQTDRKRFGVGLSIIGDIINYDPIEVKLTNILKTPLTRDDLGIDVTGNRNVRYL